MADKKTTKLCRQSYLNEFVLQPGLARSGLKTVRVSVEKTFLGDFVLSVPNTSIRLGGAEL